jgi:hypothetical protein
MATSRPTSLEMNVVKLRHCAGALSPHWLSTPQPAMQASSAVKTSPNSNT